MRTQHDRLDDHSGTDLDTNIVLSGTIAGIPAGGTLADALAALDGAVSGGPLPDIDDTRVINTGTIVIGGSSYLVGEDLHTILLAIATELGGGPSTAYYIPVGGTAGQTLLKSSSTDGDVAWTTIIPTGGSPGDVLRKTSGGTYSSSWQAFDHSGLSGLTGTDDHTQYLNATRHAAINHTGIPGVGGGGGGGGSLAGLVDDSVAHAETLVAPYDKFYSSDGNSRLYLQSTFVELLTGVTGFASMVDLSMDGYSGSTTLYGRAASGIQGYLTIDADSQNVDLYAYDSVNYTPGHQGRLQFDLDDGSVLLFGRGAAGFAELYLSGDTGDYGYIDVPGEFDIYANGDMYVNPTGFLYMSGTFVDMRDTTGLLFIPQLTADPAGVEGGMYYNLTTHKFRGYNGTAWVDLA